MPADCPSRATVDFGLLLQKEFDRGGVLLVGLIRVFRLPASENRSNRLGDNRGF
jgi:hypothetical protein